MIATNGTLESPTEARRGNAAAPGTAGAGPRVVVASTTGRPRPELIDRFSALGATVTDLPSLSALLSHLETRPVDLCVVDLTAERSPGTPVRVLRARHPRLRLVGIVDPHEPLSAGDAVQHGLSDVIPWPVADRDVSLLLSNAADRVAWSGTGVTADGSGDEPVFTQSQAMQDVLDRAAAIAARRASAMVVGEQGTGRGLMARTLHRMSGSERPFVDLDALTVPPQALERALFGVPLDRRDDKTAMVQVGADGAVFRAHTGTLFLMHVEEMPARVQSGLARLLRDREAQHVTRREVVELDLRVVAAVEPARDDNDASAGRIQPDLADRLSAGRLDMPPLRRRREDLPALSAWLLSRACHRTGVSGKVFSRSALALVAALPWHGNVAELGGLVDSLVRHVSRPVLQLEDVLEYASLDGLATRVDAGLTLRDAKARFERECIVAVLRRHHGRVGEAAKALGIQRTNLYRKVRQLNVARSLLSARR